MGVFLIETYSLKEGKEKEHEKFVIEILEYIRKHRGYFKELKSQRFFRRFIGGEERGRYISIQEYESLADMEKLDRKILEDKAYLKLINQWLGLVEKDSMKGELWFDRLRKYWIKNS